MPNYNEVGHICGKTERICVPAIQSPMNSRAWLWYVGFEGKPIGPWREIYSLIWLDDGRYRVTFRDGTFRLMDKSEPIYVELGT